MQYIFIMGLVLVCIFFIVMALLSIKTWRWLHVLSMFFVFSMSIWFAVMMASAGKTRAWKQVAEENEQKVEDLMLEIDNMTRGDPTELTFSPGSIISLRKTFNRETFGLGRVWRECQLTQSPGDWSQINVRTIPVTEENPDEYPPNGIEPSTLLYVFSEYDPPEGTFRVPNLYLGEFTVEVADDDSATLTLKNLMASPSELNQAAGSTLVLYELLPLDRHDIFDDAMALNLELLDIGSEDFDDEELLQRLLERRQFVEARFATIADQFPPELTPPEPRTAEYEALIDRYAFDEIPLPLIQRLIARLDNRINTEFTPELEETWVRIRFKSNQDPYPVDMDEETAGDVTGQQDFNSQGLARIRSLRQGYATDLSAGDEVIVDAPTGLEGYLDVNGINRPPLARDETSIAEVVFRIFRRQLSDYAFLFHELQVRMQVLDRRIAQVNRDIVFTDQAYDDAMSQTMAREAIEADYFTDRDHFNSDLQTVTAHREQLERDVADKQGNINRLYAATRALEAQKAQIEYLLTRYIDRRTAEALDALDE